MEPILRAEKLTKRFGELTANREIDIDIHAGEIHAIAGENGAGKSTLMKMLYGVYQPTAGNLYIVQYKIFPDGIVKVNAAFTSTSMEETPTEVSEATRTATFSPEVKAAREKTSKLEVPRIGVRFRIRNRRCGNYQHIKARKRGPAYDT